MLWKTLLLSSILFLGIFSCGISSNQNSQDPFEELIDAHFINAPVRGISYQRSSGVSGQTGADGFFQCYRGGRRRV